MSTHKCEKTLRLKKTIAERGTHSHVKDIQGCAAALMGCFLTKNPQTLVSFTPKYPKYGPVFPKFAIKFEKLAYISRKIP